LRVIVAGSRLFDNYKLLKDTMDSFIGKLPEEEKKSLEFISGSAQGADIYGEVWEVNNHYLTRRFELTSQEKLEEMVDYAAKDNGFLIAFWDGKSSGTKKLIDLAHERNLNMKIVIC